MFIGLYDVSLTPIYRIFQCKVKRRIIHPLLEFIKLFQFYFKHSSCSSFINITLIFILILHLWLDHLLNTLCKTLQVFLGLTWTFISKRTLILSIHSRFEFSNLVPTHQIYFVLSISIRAWVVVLWIHKIRL